MKTPVNSTVTCQSNDVCQASKENNTVETKKEASFSDILSELNTDASKGNSGNSTPSQARKRKIEDTSLSTNLINDAKEFKIEEPKQEDVLSNVCGRPDLDGGVVASSTIENNNNNNTNAFLQTHNQVYVFSSKLANQAAEAVMNGKCSSIIDYHRSLPSTTQFLSNMAVSGNRLGNSVVDWHHVHVKSESQIKNSNLLTPEQLRKRHENLAKLKGIGEMLNVLPQNGSTRSRSMNKGLNDPMMMMGSGGSCVGSGGGPPTMSPAGVMMMPTYEQQNDFMSSSECNNNAAQLDWQRLQADFFEKRAKEQMNNVGRSNNEQQQRSLSSSSQPFTGSAEIESRMICKVGQPEHFTSSEMILRKATSKGCEMQMTPSPQQMNYSDIEGQELVITKQLNRSFKNSNDSAQQMTAPLSSMLQMTNNIPKPASNSFNIRRSPVLSSSKLIEKSTPPPPSAAALQSAATSPAQRLTPAAAAAMQQRLDYMSKSGMTHHHPRFIDEPGSSFLDRQHHQAPAAINNTYVNATMSIQQLNIQSVAAAPQQSNVPFTANMQIQQQNAHLNAHQEFLNESNDLRQQQQLLMIQQQQHHHQQQQQQRGAGRCMPPSPAPSSLSGMQRFRPEYDFIPNPMRKQFMDGSLPPPQPSQQAQLAMMMGAGGGVGGPMQRMPPYNNFMENVGPGRPQYDCFAGEHMMMQAGPQPSRPMELSSFLSPQQQQEIYQSMDNLNDPLMFPGENSPQMMMYTNGSSKCNPIRGGAGPPSGLMPMNNSQLLTSHAPDPIFPPLDPFSNVGAFHNQSGFGETYGPPKGLL